MRRPMPLRQLKHRPPAFFRFRAFSIAPLKTSVPVPLCILSFGPEPSQHRTNIVLTKMPKNGWDRHFSLTKMLANSPLWGVTPEAIDRNLWFLCLSGGFWGNRRAVTSNEKGSPTSTTVSASFFLQQSIITACKIVRLRTLIDSSVVVCFQRRRS